MRLRRKPPNKPSKKSKKMGGLFSATRRYRFNFWKNEVDKSIENSTV